MANNAINSLNYGGNTYVMTLPYGVCTTAAETAAKVVTVDNFSLEAGAVIIVKFSNANTAENPTLNVNGLGAKAIVKYGESAVANDAAGSWAAGAVQMFTYDGGYWVRDYWSDQNTDTKVTQTKRTTNGEFPLLLRGSSAGTSNTTTTTSFGTKMTANPSTGAITATTFKGSVDGGLVTSLAFTPAEEALTPDQVHALIGDGGRIKRGTWSYAGNGYITKDTTGFGAIDLAGTTVIQASNGDSVYTQIYITPPTSSGTVDAVKGEMLYYINNGSTYSPTWYRVITDKNYSTVISPHTLLNLLSLDTTTAFTGSDYIVAQTNGATEYKRRPLSKVWAYVKGETDALYAPISHASTATTYGKGTGDNYGHVKLSSSTSSTSGTSSGVAATPAAVKTTYDFAATKAPINHASTETTYGAGNKTNYGHVKLYSDDDCTSYTSNDGAITPAAAKKAVTTFGDGRYLPLSGGTLTGQLIIKGTAASMPLITRGVVGSDGDGATGPLYLQYGANQAIHLGNGGGYTISADGGQYSGNAATATTASKANSAKRVENALSINGQTYDGSVTVDAGTIGTAYGGTGNTTYTKNTLIYASSATKLKSLAASTIDGSELTMSHSSTSRASFRAKNSNGEISLLASTNRGLYDETNGAWIVQLLKDASAVRIPKWASKGGTARPVYFNSNGEPAECTPYSGLLTNLSWSNRTLSLTVGGTTLTAAIPVTLTGFTSISSTDFRGILRRTYARDTSNAIQGITWYKADDTTLHQYIMGHNTGDNENGAIIINPHYEAADADGNKIETWTKSQGLYVGKNRLSYNGSTIITAANFDSYAADARVSYANSAGRVANALSINGKTYDGSAAVNVGTIGAAYGGTGKTTLKDSANALINALDTGSSTPGDNDYYVSQYVNGGTTTTTYHRRPMSALWSYIRSKAESVFAPKYHASTATTYGVGDGTNYGHVLLYPADSCTEYTTDSGGAVTPAAVKKSFKYFGWSLHDRGVQFSDNSITDLNTKIARGNYYSQNSSASSAISNGPTTSSGFRLIEQEGYNGTSNGYGRRFAFGSGLHFYYQVEKSTRGSWEPWRQLIHYLANTAIGDGTQLLKIGSNGGIALSTSTVGGTGRPVYLNNGVLTGITAVSTAYGGTGNSSFTANRLVWTETATKMTAANHYADSARIGINYTSKPDYNLYVNGTSYFKGNMVLAGNIQSKIAESAIKTSVADGTNIVGLHSSTNRGLYDFTSSHWLIYKRVSDDTVRVAKALYMDAAAYIAGNLTMSGQIYTSFKSAVATGSYQASATTIPDLLTELRYSSGCMGSVSIGTAYTNGVTIGTGWYNFLYIPHRSGGISGSASGDNCNYGTLLLMGMTVNNACYRIRYASSAISEVVRISDSNSYSAIADGRYVNVSGDTMTGLLTLSTGDKKGIKLGATYITTANNTNGEVVLQGGHLRFGDSSWDYNVWAGLRYDSSSKTIYLGLADNAIFTANAAQSGGTLALPGVGYFSINGKRVIQATDSWLRINDGGAHTSGIYFGTSTTRTDGRLEVGSGGAKFYAASDGTGYFDNDVKAKGHIFAYNYGKDGNNAPAFVFDKNGSNYTGLGSIGVADTIYFGAVNSTDFTWKTDYQQKWRFNGEIQALGANALRMVQGSYGTFLRQDGSHTYFLVTGANDQYGSWNGLRPLYFSNSTGDVTMSHNVDVGGRLTAPNMGNNSRYISFPGGGEYSYTGGSKTGYLTIYLPTAAFNSSTMLKFKVSIFNYNTNQSVDYIISGYNYSDGKWYNPTAVCVSHRNSYSNLTVRFGHNGSRNIIQIGESNTSWSYPNIAISDVLLGHSATYSNWASGWAIDIITTVTSNVTQTVTNTGLKQNAMIMNYANDYWGMGNPDGANDVWIRTTTLGIIPYQSGGHGSLGTSSWPFNEAYLKYLNVTNDASNTGTDALAYFRHYGNNDWTVKVDSGSYDYGLYVINAHTATNAFQVNGGARISNTLRIGNGTALDGNYCEGLRIRAADGQWATIIMGATADTGTNTYAWSIHRTSGNNFAISRSSSDGGNGLLINTSGYVGIGTTSPSYRLHVAGDIYANGGWFRVSGDNGLYWESHGAHLMYNNVGSYGSLRICGGAKGGYEGIHFGSGTNGMTIMSIDGSHQGLYNQSKTGWLIYADASTGLIGIGGSSTYSNYINMNKNTRVAGTMWATGDVWGNTYYPNANASYNLGSSSYQFYDAYVYHSVRRAGYSSSWIAGRDNAFIKQTSLSGYSPIMSVKTNSGSWDIGAYDNSSYSNQLIFSYCTDANYNASSNTTTTQIRFADSGRAEAAVWYSTYYSRTANYGTGDPGSSTPGYGVSGALYFKVV